MEQEGRQPVHSALPHTQPPLNHPPSLPGNKTFLQRLIRQFSNNDLENLVFQLWLDEFDQMMTHLIPNESYFGFVGVARHSAGVGRT